MSSADTPYEVRLAPAAARAYARLEKVDRDRVRRVLEVLAAIGAAPGRGGKSVNTIQGTKDRFHRLRVGDHRIMFDLMSDERVLLVLGIVNRSDLERWLRNR